jgi:hypothetical protein
MHTPVCRMAIAVLVLALAACASAPPSPPATTVPIMNYQMVAGRWAGPVTGLPGGARDEGDWVELTIRPDGSYDFKVARTIGMFGGKGMLSLKDGKMTSQGERGSAEYSLSERGGKQSLRVQGVVENNIKATGDLTRTR